MRVNKAIIIKLVLPKRNKRNQRLKQNQVATKESQLVVFDNIFTWMRANKGEWLWYDIYQQSQWLYRTWKGQWLQRITTGNPPANKHSSTSFNTKEKEQEKKKKEKERKWQVFTVTMAVRAKKWESITVPILVLDAAQLILILLTGWYSVFAFL